MDGAPPVTQELDLENKVFTYQIQPRPGEEIFEIVPKHLGKILTPMIGAAALITIAIVVLFVLLFTATLTTATLIIIFSVFAVVALLAITYSISNWISYMGSALIITNQRIIDVDQQHFFSRTTQESDIHTVRNFVNEYDKPFGPFLRYGTVTIQRYSADPLIIRHLPIPKVIARQIMHYHNLVVHGSVATAHNFAAERSEDDTTPDLEKLTEEAKTKARDQGIPVKG
jgi:hypothetical protein